MSKKMKKRFLFAILLALSCSVFTQPVLLATDEWEPYTSRDLPGHGVLVEVVNAAFAETNIVSRLQYEPWKRCEIDARAGKVFAAFPYLVTDDRKALFYFSDPLISTHGKIFYWEGRGRDIDWKSYADFGPVTWGGYPGNWYESIFRKEGIKYTPAGNLDQVILMLMAGRIDYFIEDELAGRERAKKLLGREYPKLRTVTKPNNEGDLHLLVSRSYPDSAEILRKFNAGLAVIKKNGTWAGILAKYGLKE
jgi:polar amino acid transport system substrate-binding protein